ncbi:sulfatase [bacterium]|nr:sulfatase [bacterium]
MNFILIVSDTFRRDNLSFYGNEKLGTKTPNLDKLAKESIVFRNHYTASFPTIPNRRDLFTGKFTFTYTDWAPLTPDEIVLAQLLTAAGYTTMFIADTPHLMNEGYNYSRGFSAWVWIRGQENDRFRTAPKDVKFPCSPEKLRDTTRTVTQYLRNVHHRKYEEDYFCAQTMSEAIRWLEENYKNDKFFLYVDTFDPHEPWDPPQWFVELYDPGYQGEEVIYPVYGPADYLTKEELAHMRALYSGEATMVDKWIGKLLAKVEELGLLDNTVIIFTTDHGFYLGEHGLVGKITKIFREVSEIPLLIRLPQGKHLTVDALTQPPDVMPTILELAGLEIPSTVQGQSLLPIIEGKARGREIAVSSWAIIHKPASEERVSLNPYNWAQYAWKLKPSTITDGEWTLIVGAGDMHPELYHLPTDPNQEKNVFEENKKLAQTLFESYINYLRKWGTKEEYIQQRRL